MFHVNWNLNVKQPHFVKNAVLTIGIIWLTIERGSTIMTIVNRKIMRVDN